LLKNDDALQQLHAEVVAAREALTAMGTGGYPVVYAIRVEPAWFGDNWENYLYTWESGFGSLDLCCNSCKILPDRLVGKAEYPQGTEGDDVLDHCRKWSDLLDIVRR
jgi:hypothetical protein